MRLADPQSIHACPIAWEECACLLCGSAEHAPLVEAAVMRVRAIGLAAHVGTLPCPLWSSACFEAITMWQALEHVHQPLEVLRAAYRLLTPGGRLVVAVPNFAGWAARWFGPHWFG